MGIHSLIAMSLVGGCFVAQSRWDAREALDLIERERLTALSLAPVLPRALASVRALAYAGAAMTSSLVERCREVFRPQLFVNHYGSTEIYTFSIPPHPRRKTGGAR